MAQLELDAQLLADLQRAAQEREMSLEALLRSWLAYHALPADDGKAEERDQALEKFIGMFDDDVTDMSTSIEATLYPYKKKRHALPD